MSIADEDAIGSGDEAMDDAPPPLEPTTWPRISPSGYFAVWRLKYHMPDERSVACASVSVALPLIGLAKGASSGTTGSALAPIAAGPWKCAAVTSPVRPS